ncbi:UTRA domain-containing protein [Elstera litoralis]|uniref:UTRA domain-containing protein n=1 Tax=Elstera litoralis TaxID=552518 RepID=UPI0018DB3243|nr:UTRA domain-containing protein [Elstera litoralis]
MPDAEAEPFEAIAPGPWLLGRVPWSSAEHQVRAVAADTKTADMLDIPPRSPCLVVDRRTWNAGAFLTFVRLTYPGDRHALVAHFAPSKAK